VIRVFPPDRRRRDLDNILKASLDALVKAGVVEDDYLVRRLVVERDEPQKPGWVEVEVRAFGRS